MRQLSKKDIEIMQIQNAFIEAGYQWNERIFNDIHTENCSIVLTKDKSPNYLNYNILGDVGWGRFSRLSCWKQAYETLLNN